MSEYKLSYRGDEINTLLGKAGTALQTHQDISHLATKAEVELKQDIISDINDIRNGASLGASALQRVPFNYATTEYVDTSIESAIADAIITTLNTPV